LAVILNQDGHSVIPKSARLPMAAKVSESLLRRRAYALEDAAVIRQQALYKQAYRAIVNAADDLSAQYGVSKMDNSARAHLFINSITEHARYQVERLKKSVPELAFQATVAAYQFGYYGRLWQMDMMTHASLPIKKPPLYDIAKTVSELPIKEVLSDEFLKSLLGKSAWDAPFEINIDAMLPAIRQSLNTSMQAGEGMADAMRRLRTVMGIETDQRQGFKSNFARVQTTVRTYVLEASNSAAKAVYEANSDILDGWDWLTAHDDRVCPDCEPMDGQHFPMDDDNVPPLHPNCRCTAIPSLKADQQAGGVDYAADPNEPPRDTLDSWLQTLGIILMINDFITPAISADALDSSQI
jgi:SPP1 gp7 family putative phage head morphogenesis protein